MSAASEKAMKAAGDREIARAAGSGDRQAQRALAERLVDRVRTTVAYLAPNSPDVDDLAQRALIEVLRSAGSYRGESSLETWADRIATRTAWRAIKQTRRRANVVSLVADPEPPDWLPVDDPETAIGTRQRLLAVLGRLSPERRLAVVMHHVHGCSVAEIAEASGAPVNTVRDRLRVALSQLRELLRGDEPRPRDEVEP